jgi:outer membrane usher protein
VVVLFGMLQSAPAATALREAVLEISVNGMTGGEMIVALRGEGDELYLLAEDFERLHLMPPSSAPFTDKGREYYRVSSIRGARIQIDEGLQHVNLTVPPEALQSTWLHATSRGAGTITPADPGLFLNYQLSGQHVTGDTTGGALVELGIFASPGVLTNSVVGHSGDGVTGAIRLDTTFTHDFVGRIETLTVGDSISDSSSWSNAVRFGGFHWGTNFGIRPDLITAPLLTARGTAVVPSTVDVFVNGQRVSSESVPAGPFVIDHVPAVTGAGDLRLVVLDALGREQVITQPFYAGTSLLAQGLSDYSFDAGVARQNYALDSFDYSGPVVSANYRRGLTNALTLEGHAEFEGRGQYQPYDSRAAGLDLATRLGQWAIVSLTVAQGGNSVESGWLTGAGFEHHGPRFSLAMSTSYASDGFHQIGDSSPGVIPFRQRTLAQAGANLGVAGSVSASWIYQSYRPSTAATLALALPQPQPVGSTLLQPVAGPRQIVSLSYNVRAWHHGWMSLVASRTTGSQPSTNVYLGYTLSFDARRYQSTNATVNHGGGQPSNEVLATLAQNAPVGPGNGWRLSAATSGDYDASWQHNASTMHLQLETASNQGISGQRGLATGALTLLGGDWSAVPAVYGSFAVVDIAGLPNIPVYVENQPVTHTDDSGHAVLYNLRSYEPNRISVVPEDLPLDASFRDDHLLVSPPYRSGVVIRFPVERVRGGTFRLILRDGTPVPAGALVRFNGGEFHVALRGFTYVDTFDHGTTGEAIWGETRCRFRLAPPPPNDPQPDMGNVVCDLAAFANGRSH